MADFGMVIGSRFKPFSYEEMLKPIAAYTDEYNTQEAAYGELANSAAQWEKLAESELDKDAYEQYKSYSNSLQEAADTLTSEGLKPGSRKALQGMRKKYTEEIVPIEQAYLKRGELAKLHKEMLAKDPTLLIERGADQISLRELMANPELSPSTYSGAYLEKSATQAASALSKQMRENPREWKSVLGGQYYETRMKTGYSADEIQRALSGDPTAPPELAQVVSQTIQPIMGWDNKEAQSNALNYVARGMWNAIGEDKYQNLENWYAKMQAQEGVYEARKKKAEKEAKSHLFPTRTTLIASPSETIANTMDRKKRIDSTLSKGLTYTITKERVQGYPEKGYTSYTKNIPLFDSDGKLRSRESVLREAKDTGQKNSISKAYTDLVSDLTEIGLQNPDSLRASNRTYTKSEIEGALSSFTEENSPTALRFEELLLDSDDAQKAVSAQIERAVDSDGKYVKGLKKIKSWDKEGNLSFDDTPVKVKDVITKNDKTQKVSTNGIPTILASHSTSIPGQIIKIGGTLYYLSPESFGSQGQDMMYLQNRLSAAEAAYSQYGEEALPLLEQARSNFAQGNYSPYNIYVKRQGVDPITGKPFE